MDNLRIFVVFLVFLMTWQEILNQQISEETKLEKPSKMELEDDYDHDELKESGNSTENRRETKNLTSLTSKTEGQQDSIKTPNLSLGNKNPPNPFIYPKTMKLSKIKHNKRIDSPISNVIPVKSHDVDDKSVTDENKIDETLGNEPSIKEKVAENEKKHDVKVNTELNKSENNTQTMQDLEKKDDDNIIPQKYENKLQSHNDLKKNKSFMELENLLTIKEEDNINNDIKNETDVKDKLDAAKKSDQSLIMRMSDKPDEIENKKTQRKNHPFLDAIQNESYITRSPLDAPVTAIEGNNLRNEDKTGDTSLTNTFASINIQVQDKDNNDENGRIRVIDHCYEEYSEVSHTPELTGQLQYNTVRVEPILNENNKVFYQNSKPIYGVYNNNQVFDSYIYPNGKSGVKIERNAVTNYNNFAYDYWGNQRNICLNNNRNYGYQMSQPLMDNNLRYYKDNDNIVNNGNKRIWRSWKNREYNIHANNILERVDIAKLFNSAQMKNNAYK